MKTFAALSLILLSSTISANEPNHKEFCYSLRDLVPALHVGWQTGAMFPIDVWPTLADSLKDEKAKEIVREVVEYSYYGYQQGWPEVVVKSKIREFCDSMGL